MGMPVVSVAAGGLPIVESTNGFGTPVTEATNGRGVAVTKVVGKPGLPVIFEAFVPPPWPGGGGGAGSINSPLDLTGLAGWWDASVTASLTLSGSDILSVADQSGAGRTMNWTGFGKPIYNATGFNSKPAIMLNAVAVGNAMQVASFPMGTGNTLTFFWVGKVDSANANSDSRVIGYAAPAENDFSLPGSWCYARFASSTVNITLSRDTSHVTAVQTSCSSNANHVVIITIASNGAQTIYVDGVSIPAATAPGNWISGGTLCLGRQAPSGGNYSAGPNAEFGIATGFHTPTQCGQLYTYLKNKWGL